MTDHALDVGTLFLVIEALDDMIDWRTDRAHAVGRDMLPGLRAARNMVKLALYTEVAEQERMSRTELELLAP